jgi:carboxypeptidase Taq
MFGYFPSYALGHLISAQLSECLEHDLGAIDTLLDAEADARISNWLQQHVHGLGRSVNAAQLVEKVCGTPLGSDAFMRYLSHKIERLETTG